MMFYNKFLDKQMRYQKETLEQRSAEKDWMESQLEQLREVQQYIESVIG